MNQADIENMLQKYIDAELAALDGKTVEINGQSYTTQDLATIQKERANLERRLQACINVQRRRPQYGLARFPR